LRPGVAAAHRLDEILGDASARNARTAKLQSLPREEARVDLVPAAYAAPAHAIVVVKEALYGAHSALIVKQDASKKLEKSSVGGVGELER